MIQVIQFKRLDRHEFNHLYDTFKLIEVVTDSSSYSLNLHLTLSLPIDRLYYRVSCVNVIERKDLPVHAFAHCRYKR